MHDHNCSCMSNMGNKQSAVSAAPEAQGKYVRSLLDDLRQQVDQLNVEKGQLSERASRLRGERDVLLENKGQLQQRVEQLEERVRHYKRHEHKLIEENKQIQMENDEERVKEMTHVYQQLQRVVHLLQKLGKQLNSKQKHQEVHVSIHCSYIFLDHSNLYFTVINPLAHIYLQLN